MRIPVLGAISEMSSRARDWYLDLAKWHPGVLGFGGYGSEHEARILCRVLMTRESAQRNWLEQKRGWRQFLDTQVPRQPVVVQIGKAVRIVEADRGGYIDVTMRGHGLKAGWQSAHVHALNRADYHRLKGKLLSDGGWGRLTPELLVARARHLGIRLSRGTVVPVRIIGDHEKVGIISDIDDTIMISMVPQPLRAVRYAMISKVASRQAVPGMPLFLRDLAVEAAYAAQEDTPGPRAPHSTYDVPSLPPAQFYLSTGAWNTVPTLRPFLRRAGFPKGTALLRAWWFTDGGTLPGSGSRFKLSQFADMVEMLPHVKWILVGDNGQTDPQTFTTFAQLWPDQLAAVAIRKLDAMAHMRSSGRRSQRYQGDRSAVPEAVPVIYGEDGYQLRHAATTPAFREALRARLAEQQPTGQVGADAN